MSEIHMRLKEEFRDAEARQEYAETHLNAGIALQIKALRLQRGWTQQELADLTGMHQSRISAMEQTIYEGWTVTTLKRFATAFGLPLSVHWDSWGDLIDNASKLGRSDLERPSFEDDPAIADRPDSGTSNVVDIAYYRDLTPRLDDPFGDTSDSFSLGVIASDTTGKVEAIGS